MLNEVFMKSADKGNDDWVELYNPTDEPVTLSKWQLKDSKDRDLYLIAEGTVLAGHKEHRGIMTFGRIAVTSLH
jgi:hypothetical protein